MSAFLQVNRALEKLGNKKKAEVSAWFFKTGKGEYGYGDVFYGVTVPEQRKVAKQYIDLSLSEIQKLLNHNVHECRFTGLVILVLQYKKSDDKGKEKIVRFYLKNTKKVNNWDLVDTSAHYIVGDYLLTQTDRKILYTLACSKNLWERRIAIISTFAFIRADDFTDTIALSEILLPDRHDLIHKAVGWMLREVGKRSQKTLEEFLDMYAQSMPRTMLRYAIEKFPEKKRKKYLKIKPTS